MNEKEKNSCEIDISTFLDEHGILMADKLKKYEEALDKGESNKSEK